MVMMAITNVIPKLIRNDVQLIIPPLSASNLPLPLGEGRGEGLRAPPNPDSLCAGPSRHLLCGSPSTVRRALFSVNSCYFVDRSLSYQKHDPRIHTKNHEHARDLGSFILT